MTIQTHFYPSWLLDERQLSNVTFLHAKSWIEDIFEEQYEDAYHFRTALLDGVLLCKLINTIEPDMITHVNVGKSPITWLENVSFFLDACRKLGLLEYMLFDPYDLRFADDDEPELLRRNRNIAVTLFWLSRVSKCRKRNLPLFSTEGQKDDLCHDCKSSVGHTEKPSDGQFTLLVEKQEESNDFGVTIKETDEGYPLITAVKHGSYAFKSGLHIGDYVITINGLNTNNMSITTVNNKIKSVFTEGHVYLGVCRLPPEEKLTPKHKDSPLFKSRVAAEEVPTVEVAKVETVHAEPEPEPEWKRILERHKSEREREEKDSQQVKELWNKYVKLSNRDDIDDLLKEKFKESVVQTDGNDSLNRNLTLVGHKLKRNVEHYSGVCGCCVQPLATFASIHLDNTPFTYHQMCFSCKHCGIGLIVDDALTHNVFIVDGMPYCDVCIRKMGTIKFRKKNKKQMPQLTTV